MTMKTSPPADAAIDGPVLDAPAVNELARKRTTSCSAVDAGARSAYYQRLVVGGKLRKVALIACMRKLLHAIYSVATNRKPFVARIAEVAS
jgi:hypothetical protein